jgi:exonuclease III
MMDNINQHYKMSS